MILKQEIESVIRLSIITNISISIESLNKGTFWPFWFHALKSAYVSSA